MSHLVNLCRNSGYCHGVKGAPDCTGLHNVIPARNLHMETPSRLLQREGFHQARNHGGPS